MKVNKEGASKVAFTAEAERRRGVNNWLSSPLRLSVSAVKLKCDF
jgi:hypothetical protein